jgi:hypothetical protein
MHYDPFIHIHQQEKKWLKTILKKNQKGKKESKPILFNVPKNVPR